MMKQGTPLHPQAEAMLREFNASIAPPWNELAMDDARRAYLAGCQAASGAAVPVHSVEDRMLSLPGRDLAARLYRSSTTGEAALIVYFHGGGFVMGDLDTHDNICRGLCKASGATVLSVAYRLAPEYPFPAAVDDALDAVQWARSNGGALGCDVTRMAIAGDSAGGTLAAVAALLMRDQGVPPVQAQCLLYPVADTAMSTGSYQTCAQGYRLTKSMMAWYFELYLQNHDAADIRVAPLKSEDFSNLPPALVITAGYDVLCDEGCAYAQNMKDHGTAVTHRHHPGMIHAFCNMGGALDEGREAVLQAALWLQDHLSGMPSSALRV